MKGPPERLTFENRVALSPAWTSDGTNLVFSLGSWMSERQLSRLALGTTGAGPAPRLPVSVGGDATNIAYSTRSHRLVFSRNQNRQNIYRVALKGPGIPDGEPVRLIASTRCDADPDYSPRGDAVAFASTRSGSDEIWISNPDGTSPRQLTSMGGPLTEIPRWSPDGSMIAFDSRRGGFSDVYLVSSQGGAPLRLTDHSGYSTESRWSRDGRWVYFVSFKTGRGQVWKMPASGGDAIQ